MTTKTLNCIACMLAVVGAIADTYQASTPEELVSLLKAHNSDASAIIELAPKDYYLTDAMSWYTNVSSGTAHLYVNKPRVRGTGERPEDTRLIGSGNLRVILMTSSSTIENLTVTNGNSAAMSGFKTSDLRGGGIYGAGVVSNCLVIGNATDSYGGGVGGSAKIYNSRIIGNRAEQGAGIHLCQAYNCLIANNRATSNGGGTMGGTRIESCTIIGNSSGGNGTGGGCYNCGYVTNCLIACNISPGSGGGVHSYNGNGAVVGCIISNNTAAVYGGGAYNIMVTNCIVTHNSATSGGGGVAAYTPSYVKVYGSRIEFNSSGSDGGGVRYASIVSNCVVYGNVASNTTATCYGGGIKSDNAAGKVTVVYDTEICGNASLTCISGGKTRYGCAGGVVYAELHNCDIHDNYADYYGGGVRELNAYDCRIWNNICLGNGPNTFSVNLYRCDVYGTPIYGGSARDTKIHDIGPAVVPSGNPYTSAAFTPASGWYGYPCATNCLIANIDLPNNVLFQGVYTDPTRPSFLVNCTIVSNSCKRVFSCFTNSTYAMNVVNCVFYGNRKVASGVYSDCDLSVDGGNVKASGMRFSNTAYGVSDISSFADYLHGGTVYKFGAADGVGQVIGINPGFCHAKDAAHPYALRHSSCVRELGIVLDWMDGADDIRGEGYPRLCDGRVDLGCYQCWLKPVGTEIRIK